MDDPQTIKLAVAKLACFLAREGYVDNPLDARRSAKRLIEAGERALGDDGAGAETTDDCLQQRRVSKRDG